MGVGVVGEAGGEGRQVVSCETQGWTGMVGKEERQGWERNAGTRGVVEVGRVGIGTCGRGAEDGRGK